MDGRVSVLLCHSFFGKVVGCGQVNTVRLEVVYYHLVQRKHNTGSETGGWGGVLTVQRQAHLTHTGSSKGDNLRVRLSDISRSQSQAYDRGRSSIDHELDHPLTPAIEAS